MNPAEPGTDETVRLPTRRRQRSVWPMVVATVLGVAIGATGMVWLLQPQTTAPPPSAVALVAPPPDVTPPAAPLPASKPSFQLQVATEAQINAHVGTGLTLFRFAENPRILVLDFASLHEQGRMLNRVAAFIEKADTPHDRVLTDNELDTAIRARGDTTETYYYGHDYPASALARFFAAADAQHIELDPQEEQLRALLRQEGWFEPGALGGLISVPAAGADPRVTAAVRATILRHELSHGEFFTNPAYAAYVRDFWMREMTGEERAHVRRFLARDGYDAREEDVMYNEMQAYLMFTRNPAVFTAEMAGIAPQRLAQLQERFLAGMPAGWLREVLASIQRGEPQ